MSKFITRSSRHTVARYTCDGDDCRKELVIAMHDEALYGVIVKIDGDQTEVGALGSMAPLPPGWRVARLAADQTDPLSQRPEVVGCSPVHAGEALTRQLEKSGTADQERRP